MTVSFTTLDATAPTLSGLSTSEISGTAAALSATMNEAGSLKYLTLAATQAAPTVEQVVNPAAAGTSGSGIAEATGSLAVTAPSSATNTAAAAGSIWMARRRFELLGCAANRPVKLARYPAGSPSPHAQRAGWRRRNQWLSPQPQLAALRRTVWRLAARAAQASATWAT